MILNEAADHFLDQLIVWWKNSGKCHKFPESMLTFVTRIVLCDQQFKTLKIFFFIIIEEHENQKIFTF